MKDFMEYQGYYGSIHYNNEDEIFFGQLAFIRDLVSYEGESAKELKQAFQEAVDDYLALCQSQGKAPDTPFKGSFSVRTGKDLHRQVALYAVQHDMNINTVVKEALQRYISVEF